MRHPSPQRGDPGSEESSGRSISRIFQEMLSHVSEIFRSELKLARTEITLELQRIAKASGFFAAAGVLALYAVGFVLLAVVYALQTVVAPWLAATIVGVGIALFSGVLFLIGRSLAKKTNLRPEVTIRSFEENLTWLKKQARS